MTYAVYQSALFLAGSGVSVFPVSGKFPVTPHGFKDATADKEQIREWFEHTDYNIAMVPGQNGWLVVDVDLGADPKLVEQLPATFTVRTPSGGFHYYFDDENVPHGFGNTKLAPRMDIRHVAGYVVIPPSPGYVQVTSYQPVPVPQWVIDKLSAPAPKSNTEHAEGPPVSEEELRATLALVEVPADYNEWNRRLMAIAATPCPDGDLAQIALAWSSTGPNYCGDDFDMAGKFATFKTDGGVGFGTLRYLAGLTVEPCTNAIPLDLDPNRFSAEAWCDRADIAERAQLIGPISRSSRVMLVAPTGIGKTHAAMAIACAIASGKSWLPHWNVPEPASVLYIDGEMPPTLIRDRIMEAVARVGKENLKRRLTFLNYADFLSELGGFPAMESVDGQVFIDTWLKQTGARFVVFDNIQSLTIGDMKETDSWRAVQAFCRKLTDQGIGQLWVHHANKDGSMYGDKTRAYQFDTVISLKAVDDAPEGELTFDLGYQKTRELHPDRNVDRYARGRVSLSKMSGWKFTGASEIEARAVVAALQSGDTFSAAELAEVMGISKRAVNLNIANGKWARFVIPNSSPRRLRLPVPDMEF